MTDCSVAILAQASDSCTGLGLRAVSHTVAFHIMAPKKLAEPKITTFTPSRDETEAAEKMAGLNSDQKTFKNCAMMQYAKSHKDDAALQAKDGDKQAYILKHLALQTAKNKGRINASGVQLEEKKKMETEVPMTRFMIEKSLEEILPTSGFRQARLTIVRIRSRIQTRPTTSSISCQWIGLKRRLVARTVSSWRAVKRQRRRTGQIGTALRTTR